MEFNKLAWRRIGGAFLASALLLGAGCWHQTRWLGADEFVAQLQCGMSEEAIGQVVSEYRDLQLHAPENGSNKWALIAVKGNTRIRMGLDSEGLHRYRISWVDTVKHVTLLPEVDLCGGPSDEAVSPREPSPR
ncbi:MAG: hypothetical protein AAGD01_07850 [Acidobacteriota bacterium]